MAEAGTLAIREDVVKRAGDGASSTSVAEAYTNVFIKMAEGKLCMDTRYDWVTNYSSVSTVGKEVLRDAVSALAAIDAIAQDMSGYLTLDEAKQLIDVNWARYAEIIKRIVDDNKYKDFILTGEGDID